MGLLNKIKSALFEDDAEEENVEVAKKIDVEKTINEEIPPNDIKIKHYADNVNFSSFQRDVPEEKKTSPIIFDVEDFVEETDEVLNQKEYEKPIREEQKIIYGGYVQQEVKEETKVKFKPSPVISPVYGLIDKNYTSEEAYAIDNNKKPLDKLFVEDRKKEIDLDEIRKKAYGKPIVKTEEIVEEQSSLLYEMEDVEDKPAIEKISLGDAEEYFEDLGLEYDVDYKDLAKEKMTRAKKNKELTEEVDEEIKETKKIEREKSLSNEEKNIDEQTDEKNLYDLIDMMYDNKE